jgi:hypothetical protein
MRHLNLSAHFRPQAIAAAAILACRGVVPIRARKAGSRVEPQRGTARIAQAGRKVNKRKAKVAFDKRYAVGRRYMALLATYRERLHLDADPDPLLLAAVERAAELQALAEQARGRALRAEATVTLDDVVRLNRLAEQALRRLHLDRHNTKQTTPTLSDFSPARGDVP